MAEYQIEITEKKQRLDKYIASKINQLSRSKVQKLIKSGYVTSLVDKKKIYVARTARVGEIYKIIIADTSCNPCLSQCKNLDVLYEDKYFAVINKPPGLTVHSGIGTKNDTLVNILLKLYGTRNLSSKENRPGIVHRLDKDTSGLMLIAKDNITHSKLAEAISLRKISRKYITVVKGVPKVPSGKINANIAPYPKDRKKMHISKNGGKSAITHYNLVRKINDKYSVIQCMLETGRTHQIRVHMKHMGYPIIGDVLYGKASPFIKRQALHAYEIKFLHPYTKEKLLIQIEMPEDIGNLVANLQIDT